MCTLTLGWKILIMATIALYSLAMIGGGMMIAEDKARGDNKKKAKNLRNAASIIFIACALLWFFLS